MNSHEATAVRVIGRVGRILDTLIEKREPQRLRDVRHWTGLNESTCHRLLQDLVVLGLVKQIGMYYSLGPKWDQAVQKDNQ